MLSTVSIDIHENMIYVYIYIIYMYIYIPCLSI